MTGFDRFGDFTDNPNGFLSFLYDAVTAIGLSMCQAGENASFFSGVDVFEKFRHLDFEGASGRNRILPTSGTREFTTISFVMWNVRIAGVDTDGFSVIEYVPSYIFANNTWNEVPGNRYEFAGGSTSPPGSIPPVPFDYNYIGQTARFGSYIFMGIVMIAAILSLIWMFVFRHNRIVYSAQPMYLIMVCFGAVMASAAILPLALEEDTVLNSRNLDRACMGVPWLYFVGISIVLSGLLAKTKAVFVVRRRDIVLLSSSLH